ncbi:MAG: PilN domain-containing protein [Thermoanaerobaculia bacterium]|nr:PilN domain-containing protein [Thermoanaerobaculia bacterium]
MIKINLVREGRAPVRGSAGGGAAAAGSGAANANNLIILALLVIAALLAGGWYLVKSRELAAKIADKQLKQVEAQKLEAIIKEVEAFEKRKEDLKKRIDTINDLKQNQKGPVRVMDRISQDLPDLVWIDKLTLDGGQKTIEVDGRGLNPNAIAIFIEQIKADPLFDEPSVGNVTQTSSGRGPDVYSFTMRFGFKFDDAPPAEGEDQGAGGTPAPAR